ncbi:MAG: ComF family protein [Eubacteriales bacterium]
MKNAVMNLIFPPFCVSCRELLPYRFHDYEIPLCQDCQKKWEEEKQTFCVICGKRHIDCSCGVPELEGKVSDFLHLARYTPWDSVARRMVLMAKDHGDNSLYRFITHELSALLRHRGIPIEMERTVVTAIPRNPVTAREVGVDQGVKAARMLAKELGIDYLTSFRRGRGKQQKNLSAKDRVENARVSLQICQSSVKKLRGKSVILYDDVITTGASMGRAVELLRNAGVKKITVLTFAKTIRDSSGRSTGDDLEDSFGDFDIDA